MRKFKKIRQAGAVRRYHTSETIRTQNIAEHSWHVAQIVRYIYPAASGELIMAALDHDVGELFTGDIPAPFKWDNPGVAKELKTIEANYMASVGANRGERLNEAELAVLSYADMLDCLLWCREELLMGNNHVQDIYINALRSLKNRWCPSPEAAELLEYCTELTSGV